MINWSDIGIVLSSRKHGEKYKIIDVFTQTHGKISAMFSLSKASSFSIFSNVNVDYSSKTDTSLGFWKLKSENQNWIFLINSFKHIQICQSIAFILNKVLPQGVPHETLFNVVKYISYNLKNFSEDDIITIYAYFEFVLLREIGFEIENNFHIEKTQSVENQISNLLSNKLFSENITQNLVHNSEIIETHLLNIDNYYRSSIIETLHSPSFCERPSNSKNSVV